MHYTSFLSTYPMSAGSPPADSQILAERKSEKVVIDNLFETIKVSVARNGHMHCQLVFGSFQI